MRVTGSRQFLLTFDRSQARVQSTTTIRKLYYALDGPVWGQMPYLDVYVALSWAVK